MGVCTYVPYAFFNIPAGVWMDQLKNGSANEILRGCGTQNLCGVLVYIRNFLFL